MTNGKSKFQLNIFTTEPSELIKSVAKLNQTKLNKKSVFRWDADIIIDRIWGGLRKTNMKVLFYLALYI